MADTPAATSTPADAPRKGIFEGTYDKVASSMRRLFRGEDDGSGSGSGIRVRGSTNRTKHTQVRLLFVDVGNASRSQMAQAFALVAGFHAESAGTFPSMKLTPETLQVMDEVGLDLSDFRPKPLNTARLGAFDRVITFGDVLPKSLLTGVPHESWSTPDPQGFPLDGYRQTRRDIERRVKLLARENGVKAPETVLLTP